MTCQECRRRIFPENPTLSFCIRGKWLRPLCDDCPEREDLRVQIEVIRPEPQIKKGEFIHLSNKVNSHLDAHKKRGKSW